jgi:hypothetical protein
MSAENGPTSEEVAGARAALDKWTWQEREQIFASTLKLGEVAGELLADQIVRRQGSDRVYFVAALGEVEGSLGIAELRGVAQLSGPGTRDLRCAALLALTKRLGGAATPDLKLGLGDRDPYVRYYAIMGLAVVGNGDGWELALHQVESWLKRRQRRDWAGLPEVVAGVCYLFAHATTEEKMGRLVELTVRAWPRLSENSKDTLREVFPALNEDGENAATAFRNVAPKDIQLRAKALSGVFRPST